MVTRSPKEVGMCEFANHVAKYAKHSPEEMLEAVTRDAMTFSTPQMTLATFSILHVKLSSRAEEQTRSIIRLTRWIVGLTIGLGALTVALLVATFFLYKIASHTDEQIRHIYEIAEQQRHQNEQAYPGTQQKIGISR